MQNKKVGIMCEKEDRFSKTEGIVAVLIIVLFCIVMFAGQVEAEDNKTLSNLEQNQEWTTQLLWDTTNACYSGTYRWILMANPALIGQQPPPMVQRQMMLHCFCVMDKIRNEYTHEKYVEFVKSGISVGQLFMDKAYECIGEFDTMRGIIILQDQLDNSTMRDNETEVIPTEPEGLDESTPDEELEQEQSIFKG